MRAAILFSLVLVWGLGAGGALAGQMVVIDSTAEGVKAGQILDSAAPITLAAGARITLIAEDGSVRTLEGPFSGPPGDGAAGSTDAGLVASLAQLVGGPAAGSKSLGVMRAATPAEPSDAWAVNVTRSGSHCVPAGAAPVLWRPDNAKATTLILKPMPRGARVEANWPAGADRLDWPADLAVTDGAQFLVRMSGRMTATRLVLRLVPADLPSDAHRAAWMADMGCAQQAKILLSGLR